MGGAAPTVADDEVIEPDQPAKRAPAAAPGPAPSASAQAEALSALGNLGYAPSEAAAAVAEAAGELPEADTPALIRAALKKLAPKG
jgi:Holliday junction DNA helicase RuvA